mmetsp:Transcript_24893/g.73150  ORF Transcript_24893/g.73150 Transcript_24893/m.73150 type:complete len:207 (-) Transcript_24893:67-687(-)
MLCQVPCLADCIGRAPRHRPCISISGWFPLRCCGRLTQFPRAAEPVVRCSIRLPLLSLSSRFDRVSPLCCLGSHSVLDLFKLLACTLLGCSCLVLDGLLLRRHIFGDCILELVHPLGNCICALGEALGSGDLHIVKGAALIRGVGVGVLGRHVVRSGSDGSEYGRVRSFDGWKLAADGGQAGLVWAHFQPQDVATSSSSSSCPHGQ